MEFKMKLKENFLILLSKLQKKDSLSLLIVIGVWILVLQNMGILSNHTKVDNQEDIEFPNRMEVTGAVDVNNTVDVNIDRVLDYPIGCHASYIDANGIQRWSIDAR